jgi:hypothetical protein
MALQNAWAELASAYWRGEVNSECTMQACLYAALKRKLPGFYVLCEPELPKKLAPDLVVCYRNEIVAFVELKFTKAKRTRCLEDLDKLKQLLDGGPYDGLRIDPRTGCFENDAFVVAKDCLAVFGKIEDTKFLNEKSFRAYWGEVDSTRFLPLIESLKRTEVVDHQAGISRGFHAS